MSFTVRVLTAGVAVAAAAVAFAGNAAAAPAGPRPVQNGQVFVQTDDPAGNSVAVYDRSPGGSLVPAGTYPTGGLGGVLQGAVVDDLASQGSLAYDRARHLLYAVNAGSNTITAFAVHGTQLRRLEVVPSGGAFPVSITVHGALLYVLNARDGGSIQGFLRFGELLLPVPAWHRALGLDSSETPEFTSTPGQVAFTPDGRRLVVTTKNNGNQLDVFGVGRFGDLAARPVVTADPGAVPFAVAFDAAGRLEVAEAGTNAVASFRVNRDGSLTLLGRVATGQQATCWITRVRHSVYVMNAASGTVSTFAVHRAGLTGGALSATDPGTIDATASSNGRYLYVQTGGAGTVDGFAIGRDGALTRIGSVTVPGGAGGEGIAAS